MARKKSVKAAQRVTSQSVAIWDRARLEALIDDWRGMRVLVIGDVGIDRYTLGSVERISPEAPVPIVRVEREIHKLGLAANVADNIAVLGGEPLLTGMVGKDRAAGDFKKLLGDAGISGSHLVLCPESRTVLKERIVTESQQLLRVDYESHHSVSQTTRKQLLAKVLALLPKVDAVIVEDYAKGLLDPGLLGRIFKAASKAGKLVAVDPNKKTPASWYAGATILTPNSREAEKLSGISIVDQESLVEAARKVLELSQAQHVIITRGKDGMALMSRGDFTVRMIPTYALEVFDVSGAGDTVIAVLALAMAAGATLEEAATLGNLAAGVEVSKRGTATVSPDEIRAHMDAVL